MELLNTEMNGRLDMAVAIFNNKYPRKFLHQLVSSQLDMDRLDYLRRDSFYTGVQEGVIGHDRIINMLNVYEDEMVIDEKGIYSIEKFLIARRLMYWQVYLHKTVIAAESLLVKIMQRAVSLASNGVELFATPAFQTFLYERPNRAQFFTDPRFLTLYSQLDDYDVFTSVKVWCNHSDKILSMLCKQLVNRDLPKVEIQSDPFLISDIDARLEKAATNYGITKDEASFFVYSESVMNKAYSPEGFTIKVLYRNGDVKDIADASDQYNISALAKPVTKYFLCYPKKA
jgi:HD superfamily phosphohydrolase